MTSDSQQPVSWDAFSFLEKPNCCCFIYRVAFAIVCDFHIRTILLFLSRAAILCNNIQRYCWIIIVYAMKQWSPEIWVHTFIDYFSFGKSCVSFSSMSVSDESSESLPVNSSLLSSSSSSYFLFSLQNKGIGWYSQHYDLLTSSAILNVSKVLCSSF